MMMVMLLLLAAYGLGALPLSFWLCRLWGVDIRQYGSGNPGATNALRVMKTLYGARTGWTLGLLGLGLDILKGAIAVWLALGYSGGAAWLPTLCGLVAILGNAFSPFLGFRGGKGVAVSLGVLIGLAPLAALLGFLLFLAIFLPTHIVSLGSVCSALAVPLLITVQTVWAWPYPQSGYVLALAWAAGIMVVVRHRTNIMRLIQGKEMKVDETTAPAGEEALR